MILTESEKKTVDDAISILESHLRTDFIDVSNIDLATKFLRLKLSGKKNEVFCVMYLNGRGQLIEFKEVFQGTVDMAIVFPRVILEDVMRTNASSIILSHNHPSGEFEPGESDIEITRNIMDVMKIIDVNVLDHIVVGDSGYYSFAENYIFKKIKEKS